MRNVPVGKAADTFRTRRRRKDRHGRYQNTPIKHPGLPIWRSRRETFDRMVLNVVTSFGARFPEVHKLEFGVEEVPPSEPAPWEDHGVCSARVFPKDRSRGLKGRIVVYRRPVLHRCRGISCQDYLFFLLADRISQLLDVEPEELLGIS